MTRMLSELLGTDEPKLTRGIQHLERASGGGSADVRLSADVMQASQRKLRELGLDSHDTTGPELFAALKRRLIDDDVRLTAALQAVGGEASLTEAIARALQMVTAPSNCFALKTTVLKAMLKKQIPKQVMKRLGYRSADSMLKHEPASALLAAAWSLESRSWQKSFIESYKKLRAADFESRALTVLVPSSARWEALANELVEKHRTTVIGLRELGTIVLLPLPAAVPAGLTTATLVMALHAMNDIFAASTYLRLSQVRKDFGLIAQQVAAGEPQLAAELLDRPVSWQLIQRYFARFQDTFRHEMFEPHIQSDDLNWHSVEAVLESIEPSLAFWQGTDHLGLIYEHQPVSFNITDVALAICNQLPYGERIVHHFQHSLWHELLLKYLKHERVEQMVLGGLQTELVPETVEV